MPRVTRRGCPWLVLAAITGCISPAGRDEAGYLSMDTRPAGEPLPDTPTVLIIGDSVSMQPHGYLPDLVRILGSRFRVIHNPGNGGDSANVLAHLDEWVSAARPDVIHFNCGLHDIKFGREELTRQQEPDAYERNLREIVRKLKSRTTARLVFALTTPVNEERHMATKDFDRRKADVELYNAIARRVMAERNIPVNDLHKAIMDAGPDACLSHDGVHMTGRGDAALAKAVAAAIERMAGG